MSSKEQRMSKGRVLIVDDERNMRATLSMLLRGNGYDVEAAATGRAGQELAIAGGYDVVFIDLRMGERDGIDVLRAIKQAQATTEVVLMTAYGTIESAVEAMRLGAFDYIQKPFSEQEFLLHVQKALELRRLKAQVQLFAQEFRERYRLSNIIGRSAVFREIFGALSRLAPSHAALLITGESGTGKELLARAIHANSPRSEAPFVVLPCAGISERSLTLELFGHAGGVSGVRGARRGLLEEASGGTLFLKDITEVARNVQARLQRFVDVGEFRPIHANRANRADVRIIASSKLDAATALDRGVLLKELFYRLAMFHVPPLRERSEDIRPLGEFFLASLKESTGLEATMDADAWPLLDELEFPGNVRELRTLLEQAAFLSEGGLIRAEHLRALMRRSIVPSSRDVPKSTVFISYSHVDFEWLKRLQVHLKPLEQAGQIERWDDTKIWAGAKWKEQIDIALQRAKIAILLISANWLASDFVTNHELPQLLKRAHERGVRVLSVIIGPCLFKEHISLGTFQAINDPARPISGLSPHSQEEVLADTARVILEHLGGAQRVGLGRL